MFFKKYKKEIENLKDKIRALESDLKASDSSSNRQNEVIIELGQRLDAARDETKRHIDELVKLQATIDIYKEERDKLYEYCNSESLKNPEILLKVIKTISDSDLKLENSELAFKVKDLESTVERLNLELRMERQRRDYFPVNPLLLANCQLWH